MLGTDGSDKGVHFNVFLDYYAYLVVKTSLVIKQLVIKELGRQLVFYEEYQKEKAKSEQEKIINEFLYKERFWSYDMDDKNKDKRQRNRIFYPDDVGKTWMTKPDNTGFDKKIEEISYKDKIIPFYITKIFGDVNDWRTVSFNATIDNLSQTFNPSWDKQNFFGRTEGLSYYTNTDRNISVGFTLIPDSIEDLPYIYKKLNWLTKMSYPEYDGNGSFKSFPIVRLKIGDLFSAEGNKGLAGYFTDFSHDFDPSGTTWEIINGLRLPIKIAVSFNFNVIHDSMPSSNKDFNIFHTRDIANLEIESGMDSELKSNMTNRSLKIKTELNNKVKEKHSKFRDEIQALVIAFPAKLAQTTDSSLRDKIQTQTNLLIRELYNE